MNKNYLIMTVINEIYFKFDYSEIKIQPLK